MNAEQLARDIKSLDQAHRELDQVVKPYPGLSIGAKVESLVKNIISVECSHRTHEQLNRLEPNFPKFGRLHERIKPLVDELLKLRSIDAKAASSNYDLQRQLEFLKQIRGDEFAELQRLRDQVSAQAIIFDQIRTAARKALGMSELGTAGMTTLGMVEEVAGRLESMRAKCDEQEKELELLKQKQPCPSNWSVCRSFRAGLFRVVRGVEDATPHPVSRAVAEAIAGELNAR